MNYYRLHIGDYLRDASHLSLLEHGVFTRLLQVYYTRETPIADAEKYRLIGARSEEERQAVDTVLAEFFTLTDAGWQQSRCDREIAAYQEKADRNREVGRLGGRPVKAKNPEETQTVSTPNPDVTLANSQEPIAKKKKETHTPAAVLAVPDDVPAELWADWLRVRKAKRSGAVTATALAGIRREAERAGLSLADAIRTCCERSWVGFNAEWMRPAGNGPPAVVTPKRADWQRDTASMLAKAAQIGLSVNGEWTSEELRWHILQRLRSPIAA